MTNEIPEDILKKIDELFKSDVDKETVFQTILKLYETSWGVGTSQLARSLLVLSDGNVVELQKITNNSMEPRDIILAAETKTGNPT